MKCVPQSSRHHQQLPSKREREEKSKECECVTMKMTSNYHLAPLSVHTGLGLADKFEL